MAYTAVWWRTPGDVLTESNMCMVRSLLRPFWVPYYFKFDGWCGEMGISGNGSANCEQLAMIIHSPFRLNACIQGLSHFTYFHFAYSHFNLLRTILPTQHICGKFYLQVSASARSFKLSSVTNNDDFIIISIFH